MRFLDLNKFGEIGSNATFVKIGAFSILIDSGLHPKKNGNEALPDYNAIEDASIDLIFLTHCHLDHIGSLPISARNNPEAQIITTLPNLSLAPRMLRNSINVMRRQREELGLVEYPLYLHRDIDHVRKKLLGIAFGKPKLFNKDGDTLEVILHPAGHVAGACAVEIINQGKRIVFSGDVLFEAQRTLPGARLPKYPIDTLFLETTRGYTKRDIACKRETEVNRLIESINKILERGGTCLIPVFALGRMQEIFKIVHESMDEGTLKRAPVYSTGLGIDICNYFDRINQRTGLIDFNLKIIEGLEIKAPDSKLKPGRNIKNKGIYIVSSGMVIERTPSYKVAASVLPHGDNGLCFVGYCDPSTPGGLLLEAKQKNEKNFYFEAYDYLSPIRASVERFDLSGHADREALLEYAIGTKAKTIILNHGDKHARKWFLESLNKAMPETEVLDPIPSKEYSV